jgi:DNA primase
VIRREDVEYVRERSGIADVVGEHVTLKAAGVGSMKGLCPFHDERTPSFHVRPPVNLWHCFGCGEGGDVIAFVQKIDHLSFTEAVERLAARIGYTLRYEDDGGRPAPRQDGSGRKRLLEANRAVAGFYAEQLGTPDAATARHFLTGRGFDRDAADHFGVGFAPRSGDAALRHLRGRGFTEDELVSSGIAGRGQRGLYDRFRGRLVWPIRDLTGDVVGFGARRLFDDDRIEAKYLNTPETAVYKKSQLLYGVDLAKREIARTRRVVVVEGYTDVMACHLAGVGTAVATCGTAFGTDHIRIVRRLLGDDGSRGTEVIFTFDGDEAGQKAAMRAFGEDQRFVAQTFVAVARDGMDPCDLRQQRGDQAVRELVDTRQPLFEFAIRTTLAGFDLDTVEGRVAALRQAAPVVGRIRDGSRRPEYTRQLAGWLGMEVEPVTAAVNRAMRQPQGDGQQNAHQNPHQIPSQNANQNPTRNGREHAGGTRPEGQPRPAPAPRPADADPRDPVARVEREALHCLLQVPHLVPAADADGLGDDAFTVPAYRAVHDAIRACGGMAEAGRLSEAAWVERVRSTAPTTITDLITRLAVDPIPADGEDAVARYAESLVLRVAELEATRQVGILHSRLQRMPPDDPGILAAMTEVTAAEGRRRALRERISGN